MSAQPTAPSPVPDAAPPGEPAPGYRWIQATLDEWTDVQRAREFGALPDAALAEMGARKDAAYLERNQVVAALAKCFPSGIARTAIEGWSEDWHGCVYIDLPTGQASWHFHDSQAYLFAGLPPYKGSWDGHDTPEKYRRLAALALPDAGRAGELTDAQILALTDGLMVTGDNQLRASGYAYRSIGETTNVLARDLIALVRAALAAQPVEAGAGQTIKHLQDVLGERNTEIATLRRKLSESMRAAPAPAIEQAAGGGAPAPMTDTDVARIFRRVYGATRWNQTEREFAAEIAAFRDSQWLATPPAAVLEAPAGQVPVAASRWHIDRANDWCAVAGALQEHWSWHILDRGMPGLLECIAMICREANAYRRIARPVANLLDAAELLWSEVPVNELQPRIWELKDALAEVADPARASAALPDAALSAPTSEPEQTR